MEHGRERWGGSWCRGGGGVSESQGRQEGERELVWRQYCKYRKSSWAACNRWAQDTIEGSAESLKCTHIFFWRGDGPLVQGVPAHCFRLRWCYRCFNFWCVDHAKYLAKSLFLCILILRKPILILRKPSLNKCWQKIINATDSIEPKHHFNFYFY